MISKKVANQTDVAGRAFFPDWYERHWPAVSRTMSSEKNDKVKGTDVYWELKKATF